MGWEQISKIFGLDDAGGSYDALGSRTAISGNYAIASSDFANENAGAVTFFKREGYNWKVDKRFDYSNTPVNYGGSQNVDIDGNYAISSTVAGVNREALTIIYEKQNGEWNEVKRIGGRAISGADRTLNGKVGISGNYAIISTKEGDFGKFFIYQRQDGEWKEAFSKSGTDEVINYSETSTVISGNYAMVAISNSVSGVSRGGVEFYQRQNNGNWVLTDTKYGEVNGGFNSYFGEIMAIDGDYAIIGSYGFDSTGGSNGRGKVYWYQRQEDGTWNEILTQLGENVNDEFGWEVSISGNYSVVGVRREDTYGKVYIYQKDLSKGWVKVQELNYNGIKDGGQTEFSRVSIDGNYLSVGTGYEDKSASSEFNGSVSFFLKKY